MYALQHQVQRLADDHANAAHLGGALAELGYSVEPVQTNMVYVQLGERAGQIKSFMAERGIVVSAAPRLLEGFGIAADIIPGATAFCHAVRWGAPALVQ